MNYRHAYHAGNFADVLKHAVLTRIISHLKNKQKAFRVIDTHAGAGLYDLSSNEAQKTGEWRGGIGRLLGLARAANAESGSTNDGFLATDAGPAASAAAQLLADYLDAVRAAIPPERLDCYPGSPLVVRHLLRRQDRLSAIELHPADAARLRAQFAGDIQVRVTELDGWLALKAHLPPKERRGLVLVDPPFEKAGEFERIVAGLQKAYRRWPGGIYAIWYPLKDRPAVEHFRQALHGTGIPSILDLELTIRAHSAQPRLDGCGMVVVNPPYRLEAEMRILLPALSHLLREGRGGGFALKWIRGEAAVSS
jgi:23S rRNA (adenine2030-N6)-methyltransferase